MACKSPEALAKRAEYQREYRRKWRMENKDYDHTKHYEKHGRKGHLRRKYGISEALYDVLYQLCEGKCHICQEHYDVLFVDHKHGTQDVRGLLCRVCNAMLGFSHDKPEVLRRAAAYLDQRAIGPHVIPWDKAQNLLKELDGK